MKRVLLLLFFVLAGNVYASTPQDMAMGALKKLNADNGSTIKNTLGISGGSKGNAGDGQGGLNMTQSLTGKVPCPSSYTEFGSGSIAGVDFKCQQNSGTRSLSYCLNGLNGITCTSADFKAMTGSTKTDGDTTLTVQSCDINYCTINVSTKKDKVYDGKNLDTQGGSALNSNYSNNNSIASMTLGAGVYDDKGNVIQAGKNPNMGKYQETILNKQSMIDCTQRQLSETESQGKTGLCSDPTHIVNIFDTSNTGCSDTQTCLQSSTTTSKTQTSCTVAVNSSKISETDTTPNYTCTRQNVYKKRCDTTTSVTVSQVGTGGYYFTSTGAIYSAYYGGSVNNTYQVAQASQIMAGYGYYWAYPGDLTVDIFNNAAPTYNTGGLSELWAWSSRYNTSFVFGFTPYANAVALYNHSATCIPLYNSLPNQGGPSYYVGVDVCANSQQQITSTQSTSCSYQ